MSKITCTEAEFLHEVADHKMIVIADGGLYRHLRFKRIDTNIAAFDLITWPGHLCYTGDMGTFVFSRIADMFTFFRQDTGVTLSEGQTIKINPAYWSEKLLATEKNEGFEEFSADTFRERITEWLDDAGASDAVREAVKEEVLSQVENGEYAARAAAIEFEHDGFRFQDFLEVDCNEYTYRFIWCCYALVWAIGFYDEMKAAVAAQEDETTAAPVVEG